MSMVKAKASALRRSIDIQNQFGVVAVKQEKKKNAIFSIATRIQNPAHARYEIEYLHCLFTFVTINFKKII